MEGVPRFIKETLREKLTASLDGIVPTSTPRRVEGQLVLQGKATAVVGMRRVGKTTLVHQIRRARLEAGAPRYAIPYVNFEDERLVGIQAMHLGVLLDELSRVTPPVANQEIVTWCFDEIQEVPGWEQFVRRLLDQGDVEVIMTGSSARLLSRELATALRGRAWQVTLFPFSFVETLDHRGIEMPDEKRPPSSKHRGLLERQFLQWLAHGGFPEVQGLDEPTRRQLLVDYIDVAILRDVIERYEVRQVTALRWLVRHLLGNAAGSFSVEKFHATLKSQGFSIGRDTVHDLLAHLEDCFLVRTVWMESASERQRMVNPRKVYPVDQGLVPLFDRTGRSNMGHLLESAVLVELQRRRAEVTYVKTKEGFEVDFLARMPDGSEELVQVTADASAPATAKRELRALESAGVAHPHAQKILLTATRDGTPHEAPEDVITLPAYEWMLDRR